MARNLNALVLVLLSVATLFHGSAAQTRHVVGDSTGWTIPSGGAALYASWAANQTFHVGDTLVFNFSNGAHDVAKVPKSGFDGCNGNNAAFTISSGPATVKLNESGEQYYICTFSGHCSLGQKLAINVSKASNSPAPQPSGSPPKASPVPAPAPQPTAPPPKAVPAPAPAPSSNQVTHTVGDSTGWTVPSGGAAFYRTWASGKQFKVGDTLVFNFQKNAHNVEEVTKEKFDSCNSTSPIGTYSNPPVRLTLNKSGEHYYICGVPGHCSGGQKLAINVTGSSTATPPSSTATPPSSSTSPSPSSPTTNPSSSSPSGAVSPPPQNNGATSLGAVGFSVTLLAIAAAFFY